MVWPVASAVSKHCPLHESWRPATDLGTGLDYRGGAGGWEMIDASQGSPVVQEVCQFTSKAWQMVT